MTPCLVPGAWCRVPGDWCRLPAAGCRLPGADFSALLDIPLGVLLTPPLGSGLWGKWGAETFLKIMLEK